MIGKAGNPVALLVAHKKIKPGFDEIDKKIEAGCRRARVVRASIALPPRPDQNARNNELAVLGAKTQHQRTEAEKERYNRLQSGTYLTRAEAKELIDVISSLVYVMNLARKFVRQKEKLLGKRGNPFAEA